MRYFSQLGLTLSAVTALANETTVAVPLSLTRPSSARPLTAGQIGLSIEPDRWTDWSGNQSHPNNFTRTLLENLKAKTGAAVPIRVGGNTQDRLVYNASIPTPYQDDFPAVPSNYTSSKQLFPECANGSINQEYYLASGNLPIGTQFTWGINFGIDNINEAVIEADAIQRAFSDPFCSDVELYEIEIGNEADYFAGSYRAANWSVWLYTQQQEEYIKAINSTWSRSGLRFRLGDFAALWTSVDLIGTGILGSDIRALVGSFSEHHYQGLTDFSTVAPSEWPELATELVAHNFVQSNLSRYTISALDAGREGGVPFVLGETSSFFGHGQPGVSNSAAQALWMIDYTLQAATLGISGLFFHQGVGYNYSAWEPTDHVGINITDYAPDARRHVLPMYYGYVTLADAIGSSGDACVNEAATPLSSLAVYQIWETEQLKRVMIINTTPWTTASKGTRDTISVYIPQLVGKDGLKYKTLAFDSLSVTSNLTWGGQSFETESGEAQGMEEFENVSNGTVPVVSSSAALLYL